MWWPYLSLEHLFFLCVDFSCCAVLSHSVMSHSWTAIWWTVACQGSSVHGDSPGKNTGVGCHAPLQGIFPTQGSNQVSHISDRFFTISATRENQEQWKWVAYPFSRGLLVTGIKLGSPALQADLSTREKHSLYSTTVRGFSGFINLFLISENHIMKWYIQILMCYSVIV